MDQAHKLRELVRNEKTTPQKNTGTPRGEGTSLPRCIAITSGKGGVGKSNIALYLSMACATARRKVLLIDADLGLANAHILLGIAPHRTISNFIENECSLAEVVSEVMPGLDLLPGASGIEKLANSDMLNLARLQQAFSSLEKNYDTLIIDTGAGIGRVVTHFAASADTALVVMTPEPTSLADAYAMVKVLNEHGANSIGVIVNMTTSDREGVETFDRLNTLVVKFLKRPLQHFGTLPFFADVGRAVRRQRSILTDKKDSVFSMRIHGMARRLHGNSVSLKQGFFERLFRNGSFSG